ncbi:MAG: hypothetical protein AAF705_18775, partial [Bacteroidota bacterium]
VCCSAAKENGITKMRLELSENLTFLNKASIIETVSHLPNNSEITIDASRSEFIHPDILEILEDFKKNAAYRNIQLEFLGMDIAHENPVKELRKATKKE